jgi:hypothetical protein
MYLISARIAFPIGVAIACGGCARVPIEVRTAMEKQAAELKQIRQAHQDSVDALFGQVRVLQHFILDDFERRYQEKYASGPKAVLLEDKTPVVIFTDKAGKGLPPSFNPDRDVIALSTSRIIADWFKKKREESDQKLDRAKADFLKVQDHIQIAQQINAAVSEYVDSLVNLRTKQNELAKTLTQKIGAIPGAAAIQNSAFDLFQVDTKELETKLPN